MNTSVRKKGEEEQSAVANSAFGEIYKCSLLNPCSLMYRFVLLSVGFNFNLIWYICIYLLAPLCKLLFVLHYAGVGFSFSLYMLV